MLPLETLFLYLQEQLLKSVATIFHIDGKNPNAAEDGKLYGSEDATVIINSLASSHTPILPWVYIILQ